MTSAHWPCADHMLSPKKKKKNFLAIHTKLSMCKMPTVQSALSGDKRWSLEKGEEQRRKDQKAFIHNAED
ncbi:unnamed protein product [Staurois parvus]|uniref:Uncharacterized protein n=1 Tax=Staurois parvus TaxID=386267 RepID=A0ABN9DQI9_9NEOB|nr:unnamed protein product [Staurois parvus]